MNKLLNIVLVWVSIVGSVEMAMLGRDALFLLFAASAAYFITNPVGKD